MPELEARGHQVEAVDLPQPGDETKDAAGLLDGWAEHVVARARNHPEPVVLVGHSRGGIVISEAAERAPDRVARLIYCAAMLVDDGETMAAMRARLDASAAPMVRLQREPDGVMFRADPHSAADFIYSRAASEDRDPLIDAMVAEPRASFQIAPHLSHERYGRVPRAYIECLHDEAIAIELQRRMRESQPCDVVITLDADHAPYLSAPQALADALDTITRTAPTGIER